MKNFDELASYLKSSRELSGISIEDFSNKTKIPKHTLLALEGANNVRLPPTIFVRGYINSYVNEFNLTVEKTLSVYDEILSERDRLVQELKKSIKQKKQEAILIRRKKGKKIIASFFIGLLLVAMLLFKILQIIESNKVEGFVEVRNEKNDELYLVKEDVSVDVNFLVEEKSIINKKENYEDEIALDQREIEKQSSVLEKDIDLEKSKISTSESLKLIISDNTWVFVENRNKTIFSGLARSGEIINVEGDPPFVLKVGMPEHVTIEKSGKLTSYDNAKLSGMYGVTFL